jgi:16S rRNA (uracil1498-N3)-methyltransferase
VRRAVVPTLAPVQDFAAGARRLPAPAAGHARVVLSLRRRLSRCRDWRAQLAQGAAGAAPSAAVAAARTGPSSLLVLSGPEGGLAPQEEEAAAAAGFVRVGLGRACCVPTRRRWPCSRGGLRRPPPQPFVENPEQGFP